MNTRPISWKPIALCALAFGACQATPKTKPAAVRDADSSATTQQDPAGSAAEAFHAWAYSLPVGTAVPPMTGTMSFHMKGDLAKMGGNEWDSLELPIGAEPTFEMKFRGALEIESWTRLRAQMDMVMDIGPLRAQNPNPVEVGLLLIADGETIWIEPDWSKAWFLDQLEGQATGFERLVFTIGTGTVKEILEVAAGAIPGEAAEWYRKSLECASNPACLARLLSDHVTVDTFARRGQRIVTDLTMDMSEWFPQKMSMPGFMGPLSYRCEFDASSGVVLYTAYTMDFPVEGMTMEFLQEMQLVTKPFAEGRFVYELPKGRQAFPVDLFVHPLLQGIRMESGQTPPDQTVDDLPF